MPPSTPLGLHPDFRAMLSCFAKCRCRFVVIGGQAMAAAGRPRYTRDLDVLVEPTVANARRVAEALIAFGFPSHADAVRVAFRKPKQMFTLGVPPLAIDVLTSATGLSFAAAWKGRHELDLGEGLVVPFLGVRQFGGGAAATAVRAAKEARRRNSWDVFSKSR